jgi:ATP-dependent RNA helicase DDX51/DBP6
MTAAAATKKKQQQQAPLAGAVLPWLRVPLSVQAGDGVPLASVRGLDPRLRRVLQEGVCVGLLLLVSFWGALRAGERPRACWSPPVAAGRRRPSPPRRAHLS